MPNPINKNLGVDPAEFTRRMSGSGWMGMNPNTQSQSLAPEDQSTHEPRAAAAAAHQQTIQQGEAAKAAEQAAFIEQLQKRALTDPEAARQLRLLGLE